MIRGIVPVCKKLCQFPATCNFWCSGIIRRGLAVAAPISPGTPLLCRLVRSQFECRRLAGSRRVVGCWQGSLAVLGNDHPAARTRLGGVGDMAGEDGEVAPGQVQD